ncbi:Diguanylate cyclase DosC [compost metagenome]
MLPGHSGAESERVAQELRRAIESHAFDLPDGSAVTASFGVCWAPTGGDFDSAYGLADEALFIAKRAGRNQVSLASASLLTSEHVV